MKRKPIGALFVCILLLTLMGASQADVVIAPPSSTELQVPVEILMGLMGKYTAMLQQYMNVVAQGEMPDSAVEFRLAAKLIMDDGGVVSELDSVLAEVTNIAFWVRANIFARYASQFRVDLSGTFGDIEVVIAPEGAVIISRDEAVYSELPLSPEDVVSLVPTDLLPGELAGIEPGFVSLELLQEMLEGILSYYISTVAMDYDGLELTPRGMAHVVRLTYIDTGQVITLWVLDDNWELYKVGVDDPAGSSAVILIERVELVTSTLPDSTFVADTAGLASLSSEEMLAILIVKALAVSLTGIPVVADLSISAPEVLQGEQVIVSSNGLDAEDKESDLIAKMEYRSSSGSWTPLEANYVGVAPMGRWEAAFAPSVGDPLGIYDFRVVYTDSVGFSSEPMELLAALNVIAVPPRAVDASPKDLEKNVSVSTQVLVTFSQAMEKPSAESAFVLADPSGQSVPGSFEWADNVLVFTPDADLMYGQTYVAKVLGTATGLNTATLDTDMDGVGEGSPDDDLMWRFTTELAPLPKVEAFSPGDGQRGVLVSAQLEVTFTEVMDQASTESAFSLAVGDQLVSGSFQWADKTMVFVPSQGLDYNTVYVVKLAGSASSALGAGLDGNGNGVAEGAPWDDVSWWFKTEEFPVFAVKPASQTALGGDYVEVDIIAETVSELVSFALTVDFDPAILSPVKVERVSFAKWLPRPKIITDVDMWLPTVIDEEQGLITIAADSTRSEGISGTGKIATLTFQAASVGESPILLKDVSTTNVAGEEVSPALREGSVQVLEYSIWDANHDGVVDIRDFITIQSDRGANSDVNGDGVTDILDMVAASGGQASPAQKPDEDALVGSFPNPFNPETWIAYQLAGGNEVEIRIYSVAGRLIRTLDLGYKPAGRYVTKATAAYWDGADGSGDRVSSGIYYYTIKAGDFSAVGKMVVLR